MTALSERPYQTQCLDLGYAAAKQSIRRQLWVLPTAAGKTVCIGKSIQRFGLPHDKRMFFLVERDALVFQAAEKLAKYNPDRTVGIEKAEHHCNPMADLVVLSVQTVGRHEVTDGDATTGRVLYHERLMQFMPSQFVMGVCDEAHHSTSATYKAVLRYFGMLKGSPENDPRKLLIGVTATPNRADNIGLEEVFDKITYHKPIDELMKEGPMIRGALYPWLVRVKAELIYTDVDISKVRSNKGDFVDSDLAKKIDTPERNLAVISNYLEKGEGFPGIGFTASIEHAYNLADLAKEHGVPAIAIEGKTKHRDRIYNAFDAGEYRLMFSCDALSEGFDRPRATVGLMGRPHRSATKFTQQVGRLFRPFPSPEDYIAMLARGEEPDWVKPYANILDFSDNCGKHSLFNIPMLFGLRRKFNPKGQDVQELAEEVEKLQAQNPLFDVVGADSIEEARTISRRIDLLKPPTIPALVRKHSPYAWMEVDTDSYQLVLGDRSVLHMIANNLGHREIYRSMNGSRLKVHVATTVEEAFRVADAIVPAADAVLLRTNATWKKEPPSRPQAWKVLDVAPQFKQQFPTSNDFYAFAQKQYRNGNTAFSKGGLSALINSFTVAPNKGA